MNIAMVATDRFKWAAWGPCRVTRIHGWNNQASAIYIQLIESPPVTTATAPPNGTVPAVKSLLASANNGFDYEFGGGISLAELTICCSTTETSLTLVGASSGLDMTIELDTVFDVRANDVIAGDLTSGINVLQVWTDATGPKLLMRVDWLSAETVVLNGVNTGGWLQIFCSDSPANGAKPIIQCPNNPDNSGLVKQILNFGDGGIVPLSGVGVNTGTARENTNKGCTLAPSTTSGSLTAPTDNGTSIRVIYCTSVTR